jgi:hypothetical protein
MSRRINIMIDEDTWGFLACDRPMLRRTQRLSRTFIPSCGSAPCFSSRRYGYGNGPIRQSNPIFGQRRLAFKLANTAQSEVVRTV